MAISPSGFSVTLAGSPRGDFMRASRALFKQGVNLDGVTAQALALRGESLLRDKGRTLNLALCRGANASLGTD